MDPQASEAANERINNIASVGAGAFTLLGAAWAFFRGFKKKAQRPAAAIDAPAMTIGEAIETVKADVKGLYKGQAENRESIVRIETRMESLATREDLLKFLTEGRL